jgi:hypothetical protein
MLTGLLQYLAWPFHSWPLFSLWLVSIVFLIAPIVRAVFEGLGAAFDKLPWTRIESLPRVITYPAMVVVSLTVTTALLFVVNYTTFQLTNVIGAVARSHVTLH